MQCLHSLGYASQLGGQRAHADIPVARLYHVTRRKAPTSRSAGGATAVQQVSAQERSYSSGDVQASSHLSTQALAHRLAVNHSVVQCLADSQPQLFTHTGHAPRQLLDQLVKLQALMQLDMQQVVCMITRQPALLTTSSSALLLQLKSAAQVLGLEHPIWFSLVAKQPELLEVPPNRLALRASQLAALLQLPARSAVPRPAAPHAAPVQGSQQVQVLNDEIGLILERGEAHADIRAWTVPHLASSLTPRPKQQSSVDGDNMLQHPDPDHLQHITLPSHTSLNRSSLVSGHSMPDQHPGGFSGVRINGALHAVPAPASLRPAPVNDQNQHTAAVVAGLQVLTRLPAHDFFTLVSLPGETLVQRLLALEAAMQLGNPAVSCAMVARCPQLLTQPLRATLDAWRALSAGPLHSLAPGAAQMWITRCPFTLCTPGKQLLAIFTTLQSELGLSPAQASKRIQQQPALLKWEPKAFVEKLDEAAGLLGVSGFEIRRMVRGAPGIMAYTVDTLVLKRDALAELLATETQQASQVLVRQPSLLTNSSNSLSTKMKQLVKQLALPASQVRHLVLSCPTLLTCAPKSVAAKAQTLQRLLGWSHDDLRRMLTRLPRLLSAPSVKVQQQLQELCLLLGLDDRSRGLVVRLASAWPECITGELTAREVAGGVRLLAAHMARRQQADTQASDSSSIAQGVAGRSQDVRSTANAAVVADDDDADDATGLGTRGLEGTLRDAEEQEPLEQGTAGGPRAGLGSGRAGQCAVLQAYVCSALRMAAKRPELIETAVEQYLTRAAQPAAPGQ